MSMSDQTPEPGIMKLLQVRQVTFDDIRAALRGGVADFFQKPALSIFFGVVYAVFGLIFLTGLLIFDKVWMVVPAAVGFPLIAPFLAAGLYEMSRRYKIGEPFGWLDVFSVVVRQQRREFGWMAFVMLFIFWVWMYQIRLLLALFLQWQSFSSLMGFWEIVTTTTNGMLFIGIGTLVGAVISTVLFTITVISMPLLLDKEIDFVSAILISIQTVQKSPVVMLTWGATIAIIVFASLAPVLIGIVFTVPILGHATWHLYQRAIDDTALNQS